MRFALPLACLLFASGAAADTPQQGNRMLGQIPQEELRPSGPAMAIPPDMLLRGPPEPKDCRDRIHTVREERGLPDLERETADPDEPLMIKAVDQRINGCSVMVMHYDINDVRQLPQPHAPRLMHAK